MGEIHKQFEAVVGHLVTGHELARAGLPAHNVRLTTIQAERDIQGSSGWLIMHEPANRAGRSAFPDSNLKSRSIKGVRVLTVPFKRHATLATTELNPTVLLCDFDVPLGFVANAFCFLRYLIKKVSNLSAC